VCGPASTSSRSSNSGVGYNTRIRADAVPSRGVPRSKLQSAQVPAADAGSDAIDAQPYPTVTGAWQRLAAPTPRTGENRVRMPLGTPVGTSPGFPL
jgi:hypothetical protein